MSEVCPECGHTAAVVARDRVPSEFTPGAFVYLTNGYYCNTKGCKHHHQTGKPWIPLK